MIDKIDMEKYIVLKREDLDNYIGNGIDRDAFRAILNKIAHLRTKDGKTKNKYLVLNMQDKIDLFYLSNELGRLNNRSSAPKFAKIKDIAVDIVNSILAANEGD